MVVSTKLKRGSLSQMRTVVAVKIISCLYEGNKPLLPFAAEVLSFSLSMAMLSVEAAFSFPLVESTPFEDAVVVFVMDDDDDDNDVGDDDPVLA